MHLWQWVTHKSLSTTLRFGFPFLIEIPLIYRSISDDVVNLSTLFVSLGPPETGRAQARRSLEVTGRKQPQIFIHQG